MTLAQLKYNLGIVLQYIRASEGLLARAATRSLEDQQLVSYFLKHLDEEMHHAEWLEQDLAGYKLPPHPIAIAMAGTMYYLIEHVSPVCLLGYMLALERPVDLERVARLEEQYGTPLLRTMRIHAQEDPGHLAELRQVIQSRDEADQKLISMAYDWTMSYLTQINEQVKGVQ